MTKNNLKFPKKVLQPIKNYLENQIRKLSKRKKELSKEDPFIDPTRVMDNAAADTEAAEESGHERITALKKEIDKNIIRLRKTLSRIKVGSYGTCLGCQKMIDTDRLAADPTVEYCIDCQKKFKKKD